MKHNFLSTLAALSSVAWTTRSSHYTEAASQTLCLDDASGVMVGLAADTFAYETTVGAPPADDDPNASQNRDKQAWILVKEGETRPDRAENTNGAGPTNSFTGEYLQVLPDTGRNYPSQGTRLTSVDQLLKEAPTVTFRFRVDEKHPGWYTLFLRWTGGDTVGGADSLYVALFQKNGKLLHGPRTLKPAVIPIDASSVDFAGCCYDTATHACPCQKTQPMNNATCPNFIPTERAARFRAKCPVGPGVMDFVTAPQWYEFAGQETGNVMNFDSEPWDATCEAEGDNTADSGRDYASWNLHPGEYDLKIFAREDGTALDAVYIAGPNAVTPNPSKRYKAGESTVCSTQNSSTSSVLGMTLRALMVPTCALLLLYFLYRTEQGNTWRLKALRVLLGKRDEGSNTFEYQDLQLRSEEQLL